MMTRAGMLDDVAKARALIDGEGGLQGA